VLLSKHTLSRLLDRLQAENLLERQVCEQDRRGAVVKISRAGKALLRRMWPVYERAIAAHFATHFDDRQTSALDALLARIPGVAR